MALASLDAQALQRLEQDLGAMISLLDADTHAAGMPIGRK